MAEPGDVLTTSLQESVLTLLTFGGERGKIASGLVNKTHFEEPYAEIAERAIDYWQRYNVSPGKEHIDDLFDHILSDPNNTRAPLFRRILMALYRQSQNLNEEYILSRITEFVRRQTYKRVIIKGGERIQQGGDNVADDLESILYEAHKFQVTSLDPGTSLGDKNRALSFLNTEAGDMLSLGIDELDKHDLCPTRKEMFVFIGPRKSGKSWFCTHVAKMALLQHWRVLDISLEMSEKKKVQRIFQSLFAIAKRRAPYQRTLLDFDDLGRLSGFTPETRRPKLSLADPDIEKFLLEKMGIWGTQLDNIIVKQFPTSSLTFQQLVAFLDYLEQARQFIPDALVIDYPWLMAKDAKEPRLSYGHLLERLRGLVVERNMALIVPHQSTREGETAKVVQGHHAAEDISVIATADTVITRTATAEEVLRGLARLFVSQARNDLDKFQILITQDFATGQFCTQSVAQRSDYWALFKEYAGSTDEPTPEEEDSPQLPLGKPKAKAKLKY